MTCEPDGSWALARDVPVWQMSTDGELESVHGQVLLVEVEFHVCPDEHPIVSPQVTKLAVGETFTAAAPKDILKRIQVAGACATYCTITRNAIGGNEECMLALYKRAYQGGVPADALCTPTNPFVRACWLEVRSIVRIAQPMTARDSQVVVNVTAAQSDATRNGKPTLEACDIVRVCTGDSGGSSTHITRG